MAKPVLRPTELYERGEIEDFMGSAMPAYRAACKDGSLKCLNVDSETFVQGQDVIDWLTKRSGEQQAAREADAKAKAKAAAEAEAPAHAAHAKAAGTHKH